ADTGATGPHVVLGHRVRLDALGAAFVNGAAINALDFDDTHLPTVIHPTAPIAPAIMATCERMPTTGRAFVDAFVIGVEVACRIGNAISPSHYARGFHITATCGAIGAAGAAGRLLGLNATQMLSAIGNAATQACGLVECLPNQAKSTSVGAAARNGLFAALLAARGWTGPAQPIEGKFGFANVFADGFNPAAITDDLGKTWELARNDYKPYPCGVVLNPVLDACLDLRARTSLDVSHVTSIEVHGNPLLGVRANRGVVDDAQTARLSIHHAAAVALVRGRAGVAEFAQDAVADPLVRSLAGKVRFIEDSTVAVRSARVVVHSRAAAPLEERVEHARGSAARPLSDRELEHKARELAAFGGAAADVDALIDAICGIDEAATASQVLRLAAARS
ncbi:MAG: MmgE/PrpD family protein, partial [Burkholderiales bacterium]